MGVAINYPQSNPTMPHIATFPPFSARNLVPEKLDLVPDLDLSC